MVELCGDDENVITNEYGIVESTHVSGKKHRRPNEPSEKRSVQIQSTILVVINTRCLC
jgi:hypothetical protein